MLSKCYHNSVHRRFQRRYQRGVLREILTHLANTLREEGASDEHEILIDAKFSAAKAAAAPGASRYAAKS